MTITARCPRCDTTITAEDEHDLVTKVQTHAREDHSLAHTLPRKHILARLRSRTSEKDQHHNCANPPEGKHESTKR